MAGGLLQLVSYGVQNKYLTNKPEITFFKMAYRRHTHFGKENVVLNYDQSVNFGKKISFTIPNNGDILSNLILHFNFNAFYPNTNQISSTLQILYENKILNLKEELEFLKSERDSLKIYCNLLFGGIKIIERYQDTLNISLSLIINLISSYQKKIVSDFNDIKDLLDPVILENSNIFKFILEDNIYKSISELVISKDRIKKYLIERVRVLNNKITQKLILLKKYEEYPISYKWKKNLAHLLVDEVELEIDGETIDRLTRDNLEIYYQHHYTLDEKNKLDKIINGKEYEDFEIFLPLNFWLKESYGLGIPIVALRYSTVKINVTLNSIENLFDLIIISEEYNKLLNVNYNLNNLIYEKIGNFVQIDGNLYDIHLMKYNKDIEVITMRSNFIYKKNLIENLDIDNDQAQNILNNYGSVKKDLELSLDENEFNNFLLNLSSSDSIILPLEYNVNRFDITTTYEIGGGDIYCEYIYLDQIEREKFSSSRLNYLIKLNASNIFNITELYFNKNLDIENYVTEIFWFLQKKSDLDGNKLESPKYYEFIKNKNIENFQIMFESYSLFHKQNSPEYFNYVLPQQYLNSEFTNNYFFYSFSLYPEENQPSGGISLGDIGGKQFLIKLKDIDINLSNPIILKIYFRKMSILTIAKGKGKLAFYNKT